MSAYHVSANGYPVCSVTGRDSYTRRQARDHLRAFKAIGTPLQKSRCGDHWHIVYVGATERSAS